MLTDEQIIARIRWRKKYRRPIGVLFLVVGIAFIVWGALEVHDLQLKSQALARELSDIEHPSTQQVAHAIDDMRFEMGFGLGFLSSVVLASGAGLIGAGGAWLLFTANRHDALLLKLWERNAEVN